MVLPVLPGPQERRVLPDPRDRLGQPGKQGPSDRQVPMAPQESE